MSESAEDWAEERHLSTSTVESLLSYTDDVAEQFTKVDETTWKRRSEVLCGSCRPDALENVPVRIQYSCEACGRTYDSVTELMLFTVFTHEFSPTSENVSYGGESVSWTVEEEFGCCERCSADE